MHRRRYFKLRGIVADLEAKLQAMQSGQDLLRLSLSAYEATRSLNSGEPFVGNPLNAPQTARSTAESPLLVMP